MKNLQSKKLTFIDSADVVTMELTPKEAIYQAIQWIENNLLPEAFANEIEYYKRTLAFLYDDTQDIQSRLVDAIEILEVVNIYEVQ